MNESEREVGRSKDQTTNQVMIFSIDIKEIKNDLKETLGKKKTDIQETISKTVNEVKSSLEQRMKEEIEKCINERCEKMQKELNFLQLEDAKLKHKLKKQEDKFIGHFVELTK